MRTIILGGAAIAMGLSTAAAQTTSDLSCTATSLQTAKDLYSSLQEQVSVGLAPVQDVYGAEALLARQNYCMSGDKAAFCAEGRDAHQRSYEAQDQARNAGVGSIGDVTDTLEALAWADNLCTADGSATFPPITAGGDGAADTLQQKIATLESENAALKQQLADAAAVPAPEPKLVFVRPEPQLGGRPMAPTTGIRAAQLRTMVMGVRMPRNSDIQCRTLSYSAILASGPRPKGERRETNGPSIDLSFMRPMARSGDRLIFQNIVIGCGDGFAQRFSYGDLAFPIN